MAAVLIRSRGVVPSLDLSGDRLAKHPGQCITIVLKSKDTEVHYRANERDLNQRDLNPCCEMHENLCCEMHENL